MSETTTLQQDLVAIMAEVGYVQKDASNTGQGYRYASADAVLTKVREACGARGICIMQTVSTLVDLRDNPPNAKGTVSRHAVVQVMQTYQKGAERAIFQGLGAGADSGDKAVMKASTAALKYCLALAFNISWGDDPEADPKTDAGGDAEAAPAKRSGRVKAAAPTVEQVMAAATEEELNALRPAIVLLQTTDPKTFETLRDAVVARRAQIKG
jgi:hypothetical protein